MALIFRLCLLFLLVGCAGETKAQTQSLPLWLDQVKQEALQAGVSPRAFDEALGSFTPDESVVELDQKQPEHHVTFATYYSNTVTPARLKQAVALSQENASLLRAAAQRYGVPASVIVALWGIESSFGKNMGGFDSITSLATLAYEGRRASFFKNELIEALKLMDQEGLSSADLQGSWAGALGQCQFMPSTFSRYAVDGDGDGHRDIWNNRADVFASIANYLAAEGWKADRLWGREVLVTRIIPDDAIGLDHTETLEAWAQLGVVRHDGKPLPKSMLAASLIQPDGLHGRSFLVYDNFRALMRWNRSTYFATTVGLFSDAITRMRFIL